MQALVILITMTAGSAAWPKTLRFEGVRVCEDPGEQHEDVRFAGDSPLEESGFEPLVPPDRCRRHINLEMLLGETIAIRLAPATLVYAQ
jgi:hypothetical protein